VGQWVGQWVGQSVGSKIKIYIKVQAKKIYSQKSINKNQKIQITHIHQNHKKHQITNLSINIHQPAQ
jgi:hypothetical protein